MNTLRSYYVTRVRSVRQTHSHLHSHDHQPATQSVLSTHPHMHTEHFVYQTHTARICMPFLSTASVFKFDRLLVTFGASLRSSPLFARVFFHLSAGPHLRRCSHRRYIFIDNRHTHSQQIDICGPILRHGLCVGSDGVKFRAQQQRAPESVVKPKYNS